jgi:hypothetical protein
MLPLLHLVHLLLLSTFTLASRSLTETYSVPRLTMHMMSLITGLSGPPYWPPESRFNSSINLDIMVPRHGDGEG